MIRRTRGLRPKVVKAVLSGFCNTSLDVADEIGLPPKKCSTCVSDLARDGIVRWTNRYIPVRNFKYRVFEVVT